MDLEKRIAEIERRYRANVRAAASALAAARREPWVAGSTGQLRPHPGFAVAVACDEMAINLSRRMEEMYKTRSAARADPFADVDASG